MPQTKRHVLDLISLRRTFLGVIQTNMLALLAREQDLHVTVAMVKPVLALRDHHERGGTPQSTMGNLRRTF